MVLIFIISTILLFLVTAIVSLIISQYFQLIIALAVGFIPIIYKNKVDKKQILKINITCSIITEILVLILYFVFLMPLQNQFQETSYLMEVSKFSELMSILNIESFLLNSFLFLVVYNIPFLVYYVFKVLKNKKIKINYLSH